MSAHRWQHPGRMADTPSPGPPPGHARSKSSIMQPGTDAPIAHTRNQSLSDVRSGLTRSDSRRNARAGTPIGTFAPQFIKQEGLDNATDKVRGIEGENDFSGKRYVWVRDEEKAFVKSWVVDELNDDMLRVQCEDGSVSRPLVLRDQTNISSNEKYAQILSTR